MELEFHQLDLRYEKLRRHNERKERQLLASLAVTGQLLPIVVVEGEDGKYIVVDGYKRVRCLKALRQDTVVATSWDLGEIEALLLERLMRNTEADSAIEQGWLLKELADRFSLTHEELARRFDKSQSWVSRRLSLVESLPDEIQARVQEGVIVAHAAQKFLVPMARANKKDCLELVAGLGRQRASSREIGALYGAWLSGNKKSRELLLSDPWLFLRVQEEARRSDKAQKNRAQALISDLESISAISRRVSSHLRKGAWRQLLPAERDDIVRCSAQTRADTDTLFALLDKEAGKEAGHD